MVQSNQIAQDPLFAEAMEWAWRKWLKLEERNEWWGGCEGRIWRLRREEGNQGAFLLVPACSIHLCVYPCLHGLAPSLSAKNWPAALVICSHPTSFVTRTTSVPALRPDLHSGWPPVPYWDWSPVPVPACFSDLLLSIGWSAFSKPLFLPSIGAIT